MGTKMTPERNWCERGNKENIKEMIEVTLPFYFRYNDNDYLIEKIDDEGYIIVDPDKYYRNSPLFDAENHTYPYHLQAKTAEEFYALPFLDGKTLLERFEELDFFNW
jgi:hypothetical protein